MHERASLCTLLSDLRYACMRTNYPLFCTLVSDLRYATLVGDIRQACVCASYPSFRKSMKRHRCGRPFDCVYMRIGMQKAYMCTYLHSTISVNLEAQATCTCQDYPGRCNELASQCKPYEQATIPQHAYHATTSSICGSRQSLHLECRRTHVPTHDSNCTYQPTSATSTALTKTKFGINKETASSRT